MFLLLNCNKVNSSSCIISWNRKSILSGLELLSKIAIIGIPNFEDSATKTHNLLITNTKSEFFSFSIPPKDL